MIETLAAVAAARPLDLAARRAERPRRPLVATFVAETDAQLCQAKRGGHDRVAGTG